MSKKYGVQPELIMGCFFTDIRTVDENSDIMRKSGLLETGAYDEKFIVEDYYRWLKIGQLYKIAYIPGKLAYYSNHGSNISILKQAKINDEDILLKLMFDKTGIAKDTSGII